MKVVAVALAAVVGLVPALAQLSYAQALPEPVLVLPLGEELSDEELCEVDGEAWPALIPLLPKLAKLAKGAVTLAILAERLASRGCQKVVHLTEQAANQAFNLASKLTLKGVSLAQDTAM